MKYRPDDAELLDAVAGLLEDEVLGAVPPALQHQVRVAANLARILQRQQALEPAALERERARLAGLLGHDGSVADLRAELDRRLRAGPPVGGPPVAGPPVAGPPVSGPGAAIPDERAVWEVLVAIARDDLAMAKPGYDAWEGG